MKCINVSIKTLLTIIAFLLWGTEIYAAEQILDDYTIDRGMLSTGAYEGTVFAKNLTLENIVIRKGALNNVLVVGDLRINGCTVANSVLEGITVLGQKLVDDATTYFTDTPSTNHTGETFRSDIHIKDTVIGEGAYKNAIFFGDLTITSLIIEANAFDGAIINGNLTIKSYSIGTGAFQNTVLMGDVAIEEPCALIGNEAFNNLQSKNELNLQFPISILDIGRRSFRGTNVTNIEISKCRKLRWIGNQAFYGCNINTLVFPQTERPLRIGYMAFGFHDSTQHTPIKSRKIFMPQHIKNNYIYGIPIDNIEGLEDMFIEDIITRNDRVYLWLDPNDMTSLRMTYGDGHLLVKENGEHVEINKDIYTTSPDNINLEKGIGKLYVPIGCKQKLLSMLEPVVYYPPDEWGGRYPIDPYYYFPIYSYFKEENIIEIEMGEYPGTDVHYHGDINGDGSTDGGDVSIMLEMVLAGGVTDEQNAVADLNSDGSVDGGDVSILLEMVLSGE